MNNRLVSVIIIAALAAVSCWVVIDYYDSDKVEGNRYDAFSLNQTVISGLDAIEITGLMKSYDVFVLGIMIPPN